MVLGKFNSNIQKNETGTFSYSIQKIKSKGMKNLNERQEFIKILENTMGSKFFDLSHSNFLVDTSPKARETKAKMNYWDFIKIKSSCTAKVAHKTKKIIYRMGEDICKCLIRYPKSKIYKELIKLNTQKPNNPVKKWPEDMTSHFSKENIQK